MYRAYHAPVRTAEGGLLRNAQGTPTNAVYIFVNMLRTLLNEHKPEFIAASFDLPPHLPRRPGLPRLKPTARRCRRARAAVPMVHAACKALGVPILTSSATKPTMDRDVDGEGGARVPGGDRHRDKDLSAVRDRIRVFNPKEEGMVRRRGVKEKFGVAPDRRRRAALMGDTIDNIKGVPGIGGRRDLIAEWMAREPDRPRLGGEAQALSRRAARQQRNARQSRGGADRPTCRSSSTPRLRYRGGSRERSFLIFNELGFRALAKCAPSADTTRTYRVVNTRRVCRHSRRNCAPPALRCGSSGRADGDARGHRRDLFFNRAPRRGLSRSVTGRSTIPKAAAFVALEALGRSSRTGPKRARSEVRDRAGAAWRQLRGFDWTRCWRVTCSILRSAHAGRACARAHQLQGALARRRLRQGAKAMSLAEVPVTRWSPPANVPIGGS